MARHVMHLAMKALGKPLPQALARLFKVKIGNA
jgi:hypothetical protein